jgi:co-chaperonin GroES (HSP10)
MTPYYGRILIEPLESDSVLEQVDKKFQCVGKIIAIGTYPVEMTGEVSPLTPTSFFQIGDLVAYNAWGIDSVTYNGKEYFTLLEDPDFILGKI